jgi:hypothetical protein
LCIKWKDQSIPFVFLPDVVGLTQVNKVCDWLRSEQLKGVDHIYLYQKP